MTLGQRIEHLQNLTLEEFFASLNSYGIAFADGGYTQGELLGVRLSSVFQPIVRLRDGQVVGHEALLRPFYAGSAALSPAEAFDIAESYGQLVGFDRACRTVHMLNYLESATDAALLSLNVHPKLLSSVRSNHGAAFERILHYYSVPTQRVIIEIPAQPLNDDKWVANVIDNYRYHGYHVAVDLGLDVEAALNGWRSLPDFVTLADFVKLGAGVISKTVRDIHFRERLRDFVGFGHAHGAQLVAVGIENSAELNVARELGIDLGQGILLGNAGERPSFEVPPQLQVVSAPSGADEEARRQIRAVSDVANMPVREQ